MRTVPQREAVTARERSGLRRDRVEASVRRFGDRGVRKFLFELLIYAGGLLWIGLAKLVSKLQEHRGPRDQHGRFVGKCAENLDGFGGLSGTRIDHRHLKLGHRGEFLVLT